MDSKEYQASLGVGIDVDWCKTAPGRRAMIASRRKNLNVPKAFKDRGFGHVRIRVADSIINDRQLAVELREVVYECLYCGLVPVVAYQAAGFKNNPTSDEEIQRVVDWWLAADQLFPFDQWLGFNLIIETTDELKNHNDRLNLCYKLVHDALADRKTNRILIYAPNKISSPYELPNLVIPGAPELSMAEWHFYAAGPQRSGAKQWTTGTATEKAAIANAVFDGMNWSKKTGIPTWVGAWMANNYNEDDTVSEVYYDGAPAGGDYSIEEQSIFAQYMVNCLKTAGIPYAVNSDTKYFDRENNVWYESVDRVLKVILDTSI